MAETIALSLVLLTIYVFSCMIVYSTLEILHNYDKIPKSQRWLVLTGPIGAGFILAIVIPIVFLCMIVKFLFWVVDQEQTLDKWLGRD